MKAILIKDYLEQRMYFMIILAVAAISLLVAAFFGQLDSGVALVILFLLQGPLFVYMAANHQISSEVNNGTWRFLSSLPVSRLRLWGAKLVFTTIYTLALYTIYLLLAVLSGVSIDEIWRLVAANPGMTLGMPLLFMTYGFFTTMLPQGFSTISTLVLAPVLYAIFRNQQTTTTLNFELAALISAVTFLVLSGLVFRGDRSMNSPWRGLKGIGILVVGIMLALGCWSLVDSAAEHFWKIAIENDFAWLPVNDGKTLFLRVETPTQKWDVIQPKTTWASINEENYTGTGLLNVFSEVDPTRRLLSWNIETGSLKQIGRRSSGFSSDYPKGNNGFAIVYVSSISNGFFRGHNCAVVDSDGNIVRILPDNIDEFSRDLRLIDDQRFIYAEDVKNGNSTITEFHLYTKGIGTRVVFSAAGDFGFKQYVVVPDADRSRPARVYIAGVSDHHKGQILLVSADDGKKTVIPVAPHADIVLSGPDFIVIDSGSWNKEASCPVQDFSIARLDGKVEPLNWIATNAQLIGVSAAGKIIAMIPGKDQTDWYSPWVDSVIEVDPVARSSKEIIHFPYSIALKVKISSSGEYALLYCDDLTANPAKRELMALNLATLAVSKFHEMNSEKLDGDITGFTMFDGPFPLKDNRFMLEGQSSDGKGGIYEVDASKAMVMRLLDYKSIQEILEKGGTSL